MRYSPAAVAAFMAAQAKQIEARTFYATCCERGCRTLRTFKSRAETAAAGGHIGHDHTGPR